MTSGPDPTMRDRRANRLLPPAPREELPNERTLANHWLLALAYVGPEHAQPVSPH